MNATNSRNDRRSGDHRSSLLVALASRPVGLRERLTASNMCNREVQAVPMSFLPVYARRFQAYRTTYALRGYKGWESER